MIEVNSTDFLRGSRVSPKFLSPQPPDGPPSEVVFSAHRGQRWNIYSNLVVLTPTLHLFLSLSMFTQNLINRKRHWFSVFTQMCFCKLLVLWNNTLKVAFLYLFLNNWTKYGSICGLSAHHNLSGFWDVVNKSTDNGKTDQSGQGWNTA